jgi:hypothetical protein
VIVEIGDHAETVISERVDNFSFTRI